MAPSFDSPPAGGRGTIWWSEWLGRKCGYFIIFKLFLQFGSEELVISFFSIWLWEVLALFCHSWEQWGHKTACMELIFGLPRKMTNWHGMRFNSVSIIPCHPLPYSYAYWWHGIIDTEFAFSEKFHRFLSTQIIGWKESRYQKFLTWAPGGR